MSGAIAALLKYETKLYLRSGALAGLVIGALMPLLFFLPADPVRRTQVAISVVETYVAVGAPLLLGGAIAREHESLTADILFTRPVPRHLILVIRLGLGLAAVAALDLIAVAVLALRGAASPLSMTIAAALPGGLLLASVALAVGTVTRVAAAGYLVPLALWLIDWGTRGAYTGRMTLFAYSFRETWWLESKLLLATASLVCCGVALIANQRRC